MLCPNCKSEIPEEAKFCPKCGFSLKKNAKSPEKVEISPDITVSPTILGNEKVEFSTAINVSPVITLESITKPEIKDEIVLERIEKLEDEIKRISTVESRDLRQLEAKYGKEDLIKILESFRILQRIKDMTNEDHKASEYLEQLNLLKRYTEGFDKNLVEDLDNILRRIDAELLPDEIVPDKSRSEIRRVCLNEIDIWVAEFLR